MLFSSYIFIFAFLPIALLGFYFCNKIDSQSILNKWWLVVSSLFFYGHWYAPYLFIILSSIGLNFLIAEKLKTMDSGKAKKSLFQLGLLFNIGLLGYFKYRDFFLDNINLLFTTDWQFTKLALPLGISFFTLQQIAFLVDVYEGIAKEKKFIDYSLFVCFFPQLIAGPIVHYKDVIPQFEDKKNNVFNSQNFSKGLFIFSLGLFKKVILADTFSFWANEGFDHTPTHHFFSAWATGLSYTFQLYFDFSGYSDMAIGLGYFFNIKLPTNFNSPFKARNVIDFWNKWHMTLGQFITTYLFTPILRSFKRFSFRNSLISVFTAMFIAGIWHGAGYTFVIYGTMYGLALVINHVLKKKKIKLPKKLAVTTTFFFTVIVFTMFRANTVADALKIYKGMFGLTYLQIPKGIMSQELIIALGAQVGQYMNNDQNLNLLMIMICSIIVFTFKNSKQKLEEFSPSFKTALITATMFSLSLFGMNRVSDFIYFNF